MTQKLARTLLLKPKHEPSCPPLLLPFSPCSVCVRTRSLWLRFRSWDPRLKQRDTAWVGLLMVSKRLELSCPIVVSVILRVHVRKVWQRRRCLAGHGLELGGIDDADFENPDWDFAPLVEALVFGDVLSDESSWCDFEISLELVGFALDFGQASGWTFFVSASNSKD